MDKFIKLILCGLVLLVIGIPLSQSQNSTVKFEFTCTGQDSTMMSYCYMKEPSLQDSGYTRGLKTGSFNYLDGGSMYVKENLMQSYGNGTINKSSSVQHYLDVNFNGTKGISEFYGKGFFQNNRAISAWKKIRYENLSRYEYIPLQNGGNGYDYASLGPSRTAKKFVVDASVNMVTGSGTETYIFDYKAKATDSVIETWDATGWSNRTGMGRIDFEHTSLMSGEQLEITNILKDNAPYTTEASPTEDWLSCCIGGSVPPYVPLVENEELSGWPNDGVWNTLKPEKKVPNKTRIQNCTINPVTGDLACEKPMYVDFSCNDSKCNEYECIYEFGKVATGYQDMSVGKMTSIDVDQRIYEIDKSDNNWTVVAYEIGIGNPGTTQLKNVTLNVTLPAKMVYSEGFLIGEEDTPLEKLEERLVEERWFLRFKVVDVLDTGKTGPDMELIELHAKHEHVPGEVSESEAISPNYLETEVRVCALSPINEPKCESAKKPAILLD